MIGLTDRQQQVLRFIYEYSQDHGWPPSYHEIGTILLMHRYCLRSVEGHVIALERKGCLHRGSGARSLRVTQKGRAVLSFTGCVRAECSEQAGPLFEIAQAAAAFF